MDRTPVHQGFYHVIPVPNQSVLFVGFVEGSSTYYLYASVAFFLAALISSLICNRNNVNAIRPAELPWVFFFSFFDVSWQVQLIPHHPFQQLSI